MRTIYETKLPGYSKIEYGSDFGNPSIAQYSYHFSAGIEISFYNHKESDISYHHSSLVAIWRIKERKQLA
jgi:hypothetical protein